MEDDIKMKKNEKILYPATSYVCIVTGIVGTEFSIEKMEYLRLIFWITLPFLFYYVLELADYFKMDKAERKSIRWNSERVNHWT